MPSATMTYTSLVADIRSYCERPDDTTLLAKIPALIMIAENKLAAKFKALGAQQIAVASLTSGTPTLAKPAFWRDNVSFILKRPSDENRVPLLLRSYEFCREYWPNSSAVREPRYYADYNYDNFLITPTPDAAYEFELVYHPRLTPLNAEAQVNWFTESAPQLMLYGCLFEAQLWLKNLDKAQMWGALYDSAVNDLFAEDIVRKADRTTATV